MQKRVFARACARSNEGSLLGLSKHDKGHIGVSLKLGKFIYQPRDYRLFYGDDSGALCMYVLSLWRVLEPSAESFEYGRLNFFLI